MPLIKFPHYIIGLSLYSALSTSIAVQTQAQAQTTISNNNSITPEAVAAYLEGVMTTNDQATNNPDFVGVQMTTCRVTISDATMQTPPDAIYLYQEQSLSTDLSEPYRQRFLQIVPGNNNRIDAHSYKPEAPDQWIGLCAQSEEDGLPLVSAIALDTPVCTVSLRPAAIGGFVGSTPAGGCPANVRGALSITNVVVLHADGMDTWDRGFDADGNQVWGAEDIPYRYRY